MEGIIDNSTSNSAQSEIRLEEICDNPQTHSENTSMTCTGSSNLSIDNDWSTLPLPQINIVSSRISGEFLPPASSSMVQENSSIYIGDLGSYQEPDLLQEATFEPQVHEPAYIPHHDKPITYTLVERGSKNGKDILCDSLGYKYYLKKDSRRNPDTWNWICANQKKTQAVEVEYLHVMEKKRVEKYTTVCANISLN